MGKVHRGLMQKRKLHRHYVARGKTIGSQILKEEGTYNHQVERGRGFKGT